MEIDRLSELRGSDVELEIVTDKKDAKDKKEGKDDEPKPKTAEESKELAEHMKYYDVIKEAINSIKENCEKVESLREQWKVTTDTKQRKAFVAQVDGIMAETTGKVIAVKKGLTSIKEKDDAFAKEHQNSARLQLRTNLYQTYARRLAQSTQEYNNVTHAFKQTIRDSEKKRLANALKTPDGEKVSDEKLEEIVNSGKAEQFISQAYVSESLEDAILELSERQNEIFKLEAKVTEIYELMKDLALLVDMQGEQIDIIEAHIMSAKNYTERGEVNLKQAEEYQDGARKKQCIILLIVVVILGAILGPTLGTLLSSG